MKKILSIFLCCCLILSITACGKNEKTEPGPNKQEDTSSDLVPPSNDDPVGDQFDNSSSVDDLSNNISTDTSKFKVPENYPNYSEIYGLSALADTSKLQYYYQGLTYAYGITEDNKEKIALIDQNNGDWIDIMNGAGTIELHAESSQGGSTGVTLLEANGIKSFESSMSDGFMVLYVTYNLRGYNSDDAELVSTYIFKEKSISVRQSIRYPDNTLTVSGEGSFISRQLLFEYKDSKAQAVGKWVYPENGDYPYQELESFATSIKMDDNHTIYTFMKASNGEYYRSSEYPPVNIPLDFAPTKGVNYTCSFDIVPVTTTGDEIDDKYKALFSGRGSNYAVGIFPEKANSENSTVFVGNKVDLNINLTNLVDTDVLFSLRYDIRDYYGNIVDSGLFVNNTILAGTSANRKITVSGNYGMYYLNLYTISGYYKHLECYPFALIRESDYKYRQTNPFGMTSITTFGSEEVAMDVAKLFVKMGVGNYRLSNFTDGQIGAAEYMNKNGIKVNLQTTKVNKESNYKSKIGEYTDYLKDVIKNYGHISDSLECGNEINGATVVSGVPYENYSSNYINGTRIPASQTLRNLGKKYVSSGVSSGDSAWFKILNDSGTWDMMDVLSVHPYGFPQMPDAIGNGGTWNFESSCQKAKKAVDTYGDVELWFSETGVATAPLAADQLSLRTQADYDMRIYVLGHSYNATRIQLYSTFDIRTYKMGYKNNDTEMGFGIFYQPDFLGRIMPKPVAAAIAAINYITDGVKKTTECKDKYNSKTLRTFKMDMASGNPIYVSWSNAEILPNADANKLSERIIGMPWQNEWSKSETVTYEALGEKVYVYDIMGNSKTYISQGGKVQIPITGSPVYIVGIK